MGKDSPAPPPPVDYAAAARDQGKANIDAMRVGAQQNNVNQYTPYGNQTFTKDPNSDQWSSTIKLSPEQQRLLDMQTRGQMALGATAGKGLAAVDNAFKNPLDISNAPDRVNSISGPDYSKYTGSQNVQGDVDFSSLGAAPGAADFEKQGQEVRDALYRQGAQTLDPQYAAQEDALRSSLANKGVTEGSEAYSRAIDDFARQRQSDYGNLRDRSILASGGEQSRLNSDALASRASMMSQILSGGQFHNSADAQKAQQLMASLGFNNAQDAQKFADSLTAGNFQNNQRGAAIDEAAYLRNDPLNAYNALATGSQVTNPNFRATAPTAGPAAAPTFAGAQAQGQNALSLYNSQMDATNSANAGAAGLAGTAVMAAAIF